MAAPATILHLRAETKPLEHRSCLTPSTARSLIDAGYAVNVERCPQRIFKDSEFEEIGATLVPHRSWQSTPSDHIVVGLKELDEDSFPLDNVHVSFMHCYKMQAGWDKILSRFTRGKGTLLDLEFLTDAQGRRVAAFGYHAGFAGAALAVQAWLFQNAHGQHAKMEGVKPYDTEEKLLEFIREQLAAQTQMPRVFVMGALGRCGRGAVDLCQKVGIPDSQVIKWDIQETSAKPGPYSEIIESDIFVNCIYLSAKIPPFVDVESLSSPSRNLSIICDVSCDTTNPNNPIPVYSINTTFDSPTVFVELATGPPLKVISIDHLPSLLPREASEAFSQALLPYLEQLNDWQASPVWQAAEKLFRENVARLPNANENSAKA